MKLILNLALLLILILCVWGGFKKGLIRSAAGLVVIIFALVVSNVFASSYSRELVPAINPFVGGYIDSDATTQKVLEKLGYGESEYSLTDILAQDTSLRYDYAYETIREIGFYKDVADELASDSVTYADRNEVSMTDAVITIVCNTIAYVGCITIAFIMILILMTAILDLFNLEFRLPNIEIIDEVGGSALGLIEGFLYCVLLCWVLGFMGLIIGTETADKTALVRFFLAFRFITRTLI